ncbi:hypothetical protein GE21DRAFT_1329439 [Neurospora crassa]|nr:hypothetical protein GE21DRAFT_1329439 [Neurospora crassa]
MAQGGDVSITGQLENSACEHRVTGLGSAVRLQKHTLSPGRFMVWSHAPLVLVKRIGKSRCVHAVVFPVRLVQPHFALGEETRKVNSSLGILGCDEHDQSPNIYVKTLQNGIFQALRASSTSSYYQDVEGDVKETFSKSSLLKAVAYLYRVLESPQLSKRVPSVAAMEVASPDNVCDKGGGHRQCARTLPCRFRNKTRTDKGASSETSN